MLFKYDRDRDCWYNLTLPQKYDKVANAKLKKLVGWVDVFCQLMGWGEITVTSYWRPDDEKSYHSILQAADMRMRDKPQSLRAYLAGFESILRQRDETLQIYQHEELIGKPDEHIHIAVKDGKIQR